MRSLIRLSHYYKPYKWHLIGAAISVFLAGAFGMLSPLMVNFAIEFGLNPVREGDRVVGIDGNTRFLLLACLGIVLFAVARGLAGFGQQYLAQKVGQDASYDLRNALFENLQSLSYAYHDRVQTGQIMSRITQDVEAVRNFPAMGALRLLYIFVMLVVALVGMFWLNWQLATVA